MPLKAQRCGARAHKSLCHSMASQHDRLTVHVFHAEAAIKEAQAFLAHTLPFMAQHDLFAAAACLRTAADIALDSVGKVSIDCSLPMVLL